MQHTLSLNTALLAAAAAVALAACGRADEPSPSPGTQLDAAIATTEQKAEAVKSDVGQAVAAAKTDAQAAAGRAAAAVDKTTGQAAAAIDKATGQAGQALTDAGITTSINAELAKDPALSALKINVDTSAGKVVLRGSAPNADARERATRLALAVPGVTTVDNRLDVRS